MIVMRIGTSNLIDVDFDIHRPLHAWVLSGEGFRKECYAVDAWQLEFHVVLLVALFFFL